MRVPEMNIYELVNNRFTFLIVVVLIFWTFNALLHRSSNYYGKIKIPRTIALLAGSGDSWVDWRAFSFQIGFASILIWDRLLEQLEFQRNRPIFVLGLLTTFVLHIILKQFWKSSQQNS